MPVALPIFVKTEKFGSAERQQPHQHSLKKQLSFLWGSCFWYNNSDENSLSNKRWQNDDRRGKKY